MATNITFTANDESTDITVATGGRGPAGSDATVTQANITAAITDDSQFRTDIGAAASTHTHVSADITDAASEATVNTVVKRGAGGQASFGNTTPGATVAAVEAASTDSDAVEGVSTNATGGHFTSTSGTDHAEFGNTGDNRSFVNRALGLFGWHRGAYTQTIGSTGTLTANRTITLPDASGTVALATSNLSDLSSAATARTNLGLGTVATLNASTTGGASSIPQYDNVGNLSLGLPNQTSLGAGGNLLMAPFREVKFLNANGTDSASIYLWDGHSGGDELLFSSVRFCFYWSEGFQFGSPASARDGRYIYIQPNVATSSDTIVESPPVALSSRYWTGAANATQNTWIQVIPSSAAANSEVLNINFGGTVNGDGSTHRIIGGDTPVKINRTGILAAGTIQGGVWNGTAIGDAYISSAATWTAKADAPITGILSSSQTFTGTTTLADITGATVSLPVGTYIVEAMVVSTVANGVMGHKISLVASGTGVINNGLSQLTANGITVAPFYALNYGNMSFTETRTLASSQPGIYTARFIATVTSGTATLKLQAAQNTSDAGNLTVLSGAMITARKLP